MASADHFSEHIYGRFSRFLSDELTALGYGDEGRLAMMFSPPREASHGDMASNVALILAKQTKQKPQAIAEVLADRLRQIEGVRRVEIASPGFVNLFLADTLWQSEIKEILEKGTAYGSSSVGAGCAVNIEYVSANPTGPLHIGHARGAVFGDVLASLMEKIGYEVTREYYVNDEGGQIDRLARSLWLRVRGETIAIDEDLYPGNYLVELAQSLLEEYGDFLGEMEEKERDAFLRKKAITAMIDLIKQELSDLNIHHDVLTYESVLSAKQKIETAIAVLKEKKLVYQGVLAAPKGRRSDNWEAKEQMLFRASLFGDDSDRTLCKSDGSWTYFAGDVAYHADKIQRGFKRIINILGSDHSGYVKRLKAVVQALSDDQTIFDAYLMHLVRVVEGGSAKFMSKRQGNFIALRDLISAIGADALRFIMLTRKHDAPLDVDVERLKEQSNDNPVFYVQYAHARCCSVLRKAPALPAPDIDALTHLNNPAELKLIKALSQFPREVEIAANSASPHRLAFYLLDLTAIFHALWNKGKEDKNLKFYMNQDSSYDKLSRARLGLVQATKQVIANGLGLMGIKPMEEI